MAVDAGSVYSSIRVRLSDLDNDLKGVYARLNQLEQNITKSTVTSKKNFSDMFKAVFTGQAALDIAKKGFSLLTGAIKDSIQVSVSAQEMISKYGVVFGGMGDASEKAAKQFSDSFDLAGATSKEMLANTGNLLQGMGATKEESLDLSLKVNTLASDLASFTNNEGGAKVASEALTKALLGEKEQMKTLGIAILDSDVKARVAKNGQDNLTGTALKLAKAQATLQLITEQSKNAIGDYARTQDSASNSQKRAAESTKELQIALGSVMNGALTSVSNLWVGVSSTITDIIKRSTSIGKLQLATDELKKTTSEYNSIVVTLSTNSDALTESERGVLEGRKNMLAQMIQQQAIDLAKAYNDEQKELEKTTKETSNKKTELDGLIKKQNQLKKQIEDIGGTWNKLAADEKADYRQMADAAGVYTSSAERDRAAKQLMAKQLSDELIYTGQNITDLNGKYLESNNVLETFKNKNQEVLNTIARGVLDGSISIEQFNNTSNKAYTQFYKDVMAATVEVKKNDEAQKIQAENAKKESERQESEAERKERELKQIQGRIQAEKDYNAEIEKTNLLLSKGNITPKQAMEDNNNAAKKYLETLYDLGYAADSEVGTKGYNALQKMLGLVSAYNNEQATQTERYEYYKELLGSISDLDVRRRDNALKGLKEQIEASDMDIEKKKEVLALLHSITDATAKAKAEQLDYSQVTVAGFEYLIKGFGAIGEEIAKGSLGWEDFAKLGLNAIATVIDGIGQQILALTAANFVRDIGINYILAIGNAAAGAAQAAVAFTAAGVVRGFAGSFADGGIVPGNSFTGDQMIARVNSGERIYTKDQSDKIDAIFASLGNGGFGNTFILEVEGLPLAQATAPYFSNGQVRLKLK